MIDRARFDVYLNLPAKGIRKAGECVLEETGGRLTRFGFRYDKNYRAQPGSFALDPVQLPLVPAEIQLECQRGAPALVDDYLPDAWGRRVLARFALATLGKRLNSNSAMETLKLLGNSRIGSVLLTLEGQIPEYGLGHALTELAKAEQFARDIDQGSFAPTTLAQFELAWLAQSGSGAGGARPKALVHDEQSCYLAKFNRDGDQFNHARVELACLEMAAVAGISTSRGRVASGVNGRDVLLLERFDIAPDGARHHLVTVNGLLKDPRTQQDPGQIFRYDDISGLVSRFSVAPATDLEQLLKLMLLNCGINNTDDHERNFSFLHRDEGYRLAPAYDLVPSLAVGEYHAAGFGYAPNPPSPSEVGRLGKVFGLSRKVVASCAEQVAVALAAWPEIAAGAGVSEREIEKIGARFNP